MTTRYADPQSSVVRRQSSVATTDHGPRTTNPRRGFTLIELMISIALVLVLMIAINYIFTQTSSTISTAMALGQVTRDHRGARKVIQDDFDNMAPRESQPGIVIAAKTVVAFRDKADRLKDLDFDLPTNTTVAGRTAAMLSRDMDADNNEGEGTVPGEVSAVNALTLRNHRSDRISFFIENIRGTYSRQTGDDTSYVTPTSSDEAWVSYGHLALPDKNADNDATAVEYFAPGFTDAGAAAERQLAYEPDLYGNGYAANWIFGRALILLENPLPATEGQLTGTGGMNPLEFDSTVANVTMPPQYGAGPWQARQSRVDIAEETIEGFRKRVETAGPGGGWWLPITYPFETSPIIEKPDDATAAPGPVRASEAARTFPIFLPGVTQFVVEFAGDFYDQGPIAGVPEPRGTIDYNVIGGLQQVRWYGLGRDVNGNGGALNDAEGDVVLLSTVPTTTATNSTRWDNTNYPGGAQKAPTANYEAFFAWGPVTSAGDPTAASGAVAAVPGHPDNVRPSLIRITYQVVDTNGRLAEGQTVEYIMRVR